MDPFKSDQFFQHYATIERQLSDLLSCQNVITYRIEVDNTSLYSRILGKDGLIHDIRSEIDTSSIAGQAANKNKVIRVNGINTECETSTNKAAKHDKSLDQVLGYKIESVMAVPILLDNKPVGIMQATNNKHGKFERRHESRAMELADKLSPFFVSRAGKLDNPFALLVKNGTVTTDTLNSIIERAENSESSTAFLLMREQRIGIDEIGQSLENYYQVPFLRFEPERVISQALLQKFKASYLRSKGWLPVSEDKRSVTVVVPDPTDIALLTELESVINPRQINLCVGIPEDYFQHLEPLRKKSFIDELSSVQAAITSTLNQLKDSHKSDNTEIIKLVDRIVFEGYEKGASDIHVQTNGDNHDADLLFRIDGNCEVVGHIPEKLIDNIITRIKIMSTLNIAEKRLPQDGKATVKMDGRTIELRVATIPNVTGRETAVLRILSTAKPLKLTELDFSERNLQRVRKLAESPHGMFLVVGPTGSGKTTTLHSILKYINIPERIIWTAEDPVEITQMGLQQVQVKPQIGFDFSAALRAFLRADPDVIMIGEIRDHDTAEISIKASLTGHLLFSTLHTNSAAETITRMLDLGTDSFSFADAILGVLSQRLVRRLCVNCKTSRPASEDEMTDLQQMYGKDFFDDYVERFGKIHLHHASGCPECNKTGYRGRIAIHELLVNNDEITHLISSKASTDQLKQAAIKDGMKTLLQDGIEKVLAGIIDLPGLRKTLGV
jgi:type II secretory ATPase GspE/PulE/Tfp pilus assembly ATPase PilB-like protein